MAEHFVYRSDGQENLDIFTTLLRRSFHSRDTSRSRISSLEKQLISSSSSRPPQTLAGLAGLLVGPFVLTFAFVGGATGLSFSFGVMTGGSIEPWVDAVRSADWTWMLVTACIALGFTSMLISGIACLRLIAQDHWQKYLSFAGYVTGIPVALSAFAAQASTMFHLRLSPEPVPAQLLALAEASMIRFILVSKFYGPALVVVLGSGCLSCCLLREGLVPRWVSWLGLACATMAFLQMFSGLLPALAIFGLGAGPLHMLWFSILGASLLLRRPT